jgi:hypothetical protein
MTAYELTYPHIQKLAGEPARLASHPRIRIAQIAMDYLSYGWSVEEMCRQHPYLSLAETHAQWAITSITRQKLIKKFKPSGNRHKRSRRKYSDRPFTLA